MLLTRLPRYRGLPPFAFDLHVLGTPPAFVLSQDQTLQLRFEPTTEVAGSLTGECVAQPLPRLPDYRYAIAHQAGTFYLVFKEHRASIRKGKRPPDRAFCGSVSRARAKQTGS